MKIKYLIISAAICMLAGCQSDFKETVHQKPGSGMNVPEQGAVPGVVRIKVSEELSGRLLASADATGKVAEPEKAGLSLSGLEIKSVRTTFHIGGKFEKRQRKAGLHRWFTVEFNENTSVTKAVSKASSASGVEFSEPVLKVKSTVAMNDPRLSDQWHYNNTGENGFTEGVDMGLQDAWDSYGYFGGDNVIVAIIDSGVDYEHEDLAGNIWVNEAELNGQPGVDDDGNGYIDDIHGYNFVVGSNGAIHPEDHGTHVAGTVAAVNNNGKGVAGVAGGNSQEGQKGAQLMCLQMMDDRYDSMSDIAEVFQYAADNGANIAQNSWGYEVSPSYMPQSDALAIDYFIDNAGCDEDGNQLEESPMKGGVVIFAAGNEEMNYSYPPGYERVIAVAAIGPTGKAAYYTNYGDWVDVAAPGGDQRENGNEGGVLSTLPNNSYGFMQGTSMACPHVSGLAALVLSGMGGPGYTNDDLFETIINSTDESIYEYNPDMEGMLGSGMIDATRALASFSTEPPEAVSHLEAEVTSNIISITADVPADPDNGTAFYYNVYYSTEEFTAEEKDNVDSERFTISSLESDEDGNRTFTLSGLKFETTYYYAVSASDFARNESPLSEVKSIRTGVNNAPEVTVAVTQPLNIAAAETRTISVSATDPDGHEVSLRLKNNDNRAVTFSSSGGSGTVTINALQSAIGTFEFIVVAEDEYGASDEETVKYTILPNKTPEVTGEIADQYINGIGESVSLSVAEYFEDPDKETLSILASVSDRSIVSYSFADGVITLTGKAPGHADVELSATDARGAHVKAGFTVYVRDNSRSFDLYPTPVVSTVNIRTPEEGFYNVSISSSTGAEIYSETEKISFAEPLAIDMSKSAPGQYMLTLTYPDGHSEKKSFVKL